MNDFTSPIAIFPFFRYSTMLLIIATDIDTFFLNYIIYLTWFCKRYNELKKNITQ